MSQMEPDYPMALCRLQTMSKDELQELFSNESKFDDYIRSLDQMKQLYSEKEMLMTSNRSLAEYNLKQEPILHEKREALSEKQREAIDRLSELKKLKEKVEGKSGNVKPDLLYSLLQVAQSEAEKESDAMTEEFLDGKVENVDSFLENYIEKRKVFHLRRVKLEKMKELIEGKTRSPQHLQPVRSAPKPPPVGFAGMAAARQPYPMAGPVAAAPNSWGPPIQPPPGASNLPYPLHPNGIPQAPNFR